MRKRIPPNYDYLNSFIAEKRQENNLVQNISKNHLAVIRCHLNKLMQHGQVDDLEDISVSDVMSYLSSVKSMTTRSALKCTFKLYLGISVPLTKNILSNGDRIDPNRFVKNWLSMDLAIKLFTEMYQRASTESQWSTLLACCIQLGTALRMNDVKQLEKDHISKLLMGESIIIRISKVARLRNKRCISSFLSTDPNSSMLIVQEKPVIIITHEAFKKCDGLVKPQLHFFKTCLPFQRETFGIRNNSVDYSYGSGWHELRRFSLSYIYEKFAGHTERDKIIAEFADHSSPAITQRYIRNIVYEANV